MKPAADQQPPLHQPPLPGILRIAEAIGRAIADEDDRREQQEAEERGDARPGLQETLAAAERQPDDQPDAGE